MATAQTASAPLAASQGERVVPDPSPARHEASKEGISSLSLASSSSSPHQNGHAEDEAAKIMALNKTFCAPTHAPIPIVQVRASGAHIWDINGKDYIDFLSAFSVVNQGHNHAKIVDALTRQAQNIAINTSAFQNPHYPALCAKICQLLGYDMASAMSSGSEATDLAIKIARRWGYVVKGIPADQAKVLTCVANYHGKTLAPLSASSNPGIRKGFGPYLPLVGPDVAGDVVVRFDNLDDLEKAFEQSGDTIAAFMVEPVQGYGGCLPPSPGYLEMAHKLCKKYNILFIADEVQTGFGRTGSLMAYQTENVKPDLVVLGKSLTGGLYPMSLVLGSRATMTLIQPGEHSSTFAANPLASAVALAAIDVVIDERLPERSARLGERLMTRLSSIKSAHITTKATGRGLFCSFHLDESHPSGRITAERLARLMRSRGVVVVSSQNRVRIAPPLVISERDLDRGLDILEQSLHDLIEYEDDEHFI